jgi:hypothetical protein
MRISTRSTILPLDCKWLEMGLQLDEKNTPNNDRQHSTLPGKARKVSPFRFALIALPFPSHKNTVVIDIKTQSA